MDQASLHPCCVNRHLTQCLQTLVYEAVCVRARVCERDVCVCVCMGVEVPSRLAGQVVSLHAELMLLVSSDFPVLV